MRGNGEMKGFAILNRRTEANKRKNTEERIKRQEAFERREEERLEGQEELRQIAMSAEGKPLVALGDLQGPDGNSFVILANVSKTLRRAYGKEKEAAFMKEATSGDRKHLLKTVDKYVQVVQQVQRYDAVTLSDEEENSFLEDE